MGASSSCMSQRGCGNPGQAGGPRPQGPRTGGRSAPPALTPQRGALTPLHIAAALPGEAGVRITELLLHAVTDVDARAADQDDVHRLGKVPHLPLGGAGAGPRALRGRVASSRPHFYVACP